MEFPSSPEIGRLAFVASLILILPGPGQNLAPDFDDSSVIWSSNATDEHLYTMSGIEGTEIAWASDAFAFNLMADGTTTFGNSGAPIYFEIGAFQTGFDPRTSSPDQWEGHWLLLQQSVYDPVESQVIDTARLSSNEDPFAIGSQAYIWGYTTRDVETNRAEWILIAADEWRWTSTGVLTPSTFSVSDADNPYEVIFGSVNGSLDGQPFHMMLAHVPAVPEPAVALLSGLSALALLIRRRR